MTPEEAYPTIRTLVLESLFQNGLALKYKGDGQDALTVEHIQIWVAGLANKRNLTHSTGAAEVSAVIPSTKYGVKLLPEWKAIIRHVVWDLIVAGVLRPGLSDDARDSWPFLTITAFGRACLKDEHTPYDPDGYLRRLNTAIPKLDSIILTYVAESLKTFLFHCPLASTITLGCASERALLVLIEDLAKALPPADGEQFMKRTTGKFIKIQFEEFTKGYKTRVEPKIPHDLKEMVADTVDQLFRLYRKQRNEAGHPKGVVIAKEQVYANLVAFPSYVSTVYALRKWLDDNKPI